MPQEAGDADGSGYGAADDALDLGPDQPLDHRRQVARRASPSAAAGAPRAPCPRCVGPPLMDLRRALGAGCAPGCRPSDAAAAAASGATSGRDRTAAGGGARGAGCGGRASAAAALARRGGLGAAGSRHHHGRDRGPARSSPARRAGAGAARPRGGRRLVLAQDAADGGEDVLHRGIAARRAGLRRRCCDALSRRPSCSAARLVGRVVAQCRPTCSRTAL